MIHSQAGRGPVPAQDVSTSPAGPRDQGFDQGITGRRSGHGTATRVFPFGVGPAGRPGGLVSSTDPGTVGRGQRLVSPPAGVEPPPAAGDRGGQPGVRLVRQRLRSGRDVLARRSWNQSNPSMATTNAFVVYTKQRVSVLARRCSAASCRRPRGQRAHGQPVVLKQLVAMKICGPQGQEPVGSLVHSLINSIPPAGISAPRPRSTRRVRTTPSNRRRVAVINGINIVKNGDFGNQTESPHNHK